MTRISLGLMITAVVLAGCSNDRPLSSDFGNAVVSNVASEVVNPTPLAGSQDFDTSGRRMVSAMERYNRNKVTPPVPAVSSVAPVGTVPQQQSGSSDSSGGGY
jgi:hypothetical protein